MLYSISEKKISKGASRASSPASQSRKKKRNISSQKAISEFLDYQMALHCVSNTLRCWRSSLYKLDDFFQKHGCSILAAQKIDIYRFVSEHSKKHDRYTKEPGKLQFSYIRRLLCDMYKFYEFCDRFSIKYSGDKLTLERMKHMRIDPPPVTTPLSNNQFNILTKEIHRVIYRNIRILMIVHLLYATGVRVSELIGIKVDDIDLEQNTIRVIGKGDKERLVFLG